MSDEVRKKLEKEFGRHYICFLENKHLFLHSIIKPPDFVIAPPKNLR